jgi:hypothetical protein
MRRTCLGRSGVLQVTQVDDSQIIGIVITIFFKFLQHTNSSKARQEKARSAH